VKKPVKKIPFPVPSGIKNHAEGRWDKHLEAATEALAEAMRCLEWYNDMHEPFEPAYQLGRAPVKNTAHYGCDYQRELWKVQATMLGVLQHARMETKNEAERKAFFAEAKREAKR